MAKIVVDNAEITIAYISEDNHFNRLKSLPYPKLKILTLDEFNAAEKKGGVIYIK